MIDCKICNKVFKSLGGLSHHISSMHKNISKENYYITYILPFNKYLNSGICVRCDKPTKFIRFTYNKYCSIDCERHDGSARNAQKAVQTKRDTGVYTRLNQELVKRQIEKGTFLNYRRKAAETMKKNGTYKIIAEKSVKTMRANNIYENMTKKRIETMRKNNTLNSSKAEDRCYLILNNIYNNVKRNYKSDDYPYYCDFYIPSQNLYIECNFHWTHGGHFYNKNNLEDIERLNLMIEKSKHSEYYKKAIIVWTEKDLNKYNTAIKNNLNYLVFWSEKEFNNYFMRGN